MTSKIISIKKILVNFVGFYFALVTHFLYKHNKKEN